MRKEEGYIYIYTKVYVYIYAYVYVCKRGERGLFRAMHPVAPICPSRSELHQPDTLSYTRARAIEQRLSIIVSTDAHFSFFLFFLYSSDEEIYIHLRYCVTL